MSYWDTSALVKLYAKELDSGLFEAHLKQSANVPTTSRISLYEARATFLRKEAEGVLQKGAAQLLYDRLLQHVAAGEIRLVELGAEVEQEYGKVLGACCFIVPLMPIRTLDAIHLSSAKTTLELEIVTTDKRMRDIAKLLHFDLFPL